MSKCLDNMLDPKTIKQIFGERDIAPAFVNKWLEGAEKLKEAFDKGELPEHEFNRALNEHIAFSREKMEAMALIRSKEAVQQKKNIEFLRQPGFEKNPVEGFLAMVTKTNVLANEGKNSIDSMSRARVEIFASPMVEGLQQKGLFKLAVSGQLDDDIVKAISAQTDKKVNLEGVSKEAIEIAKVLKETNDLMFVEKKNAGIPVNYKNERIMLQTHNPSRVREAGFDKWFETVSSLNPDKKHLGPDAYTADGYRAVLKDVYEDIIMGKHGGMEELQADGSLSNIDGEGSVSTSIGSKRTLNFAPEQMLAYNKQFGNYKTVMANVYADMRKTASKVSLFERLGDKPRENFSTLIDKRISDYKRAGDMKMVEKLQSSKEGILANLDHITGVTAIPGSESLATINRVMGPLETMSKLGLVGLRSMANIAGAIVQMKNATGRNILEQSGIFMKDFASSIPEAARGQVSKEVGDLIQTMNGILADQVRGNGVVGKLSKGADLMMKLNGQDFLNDAFRKTMAIGEQRDWAINAGKPFEELHPEMQAAMLSMGINKNDWALFKHAIQTADNGMQIVTPEMFGRLQKIPKEEVEKVMALNEIKGTPEKYTRAMEAKIRAYLIQSGDIGTTTAGSREQAALLGSTQAGTIRGEFWRLFTRFKSFTFQSMNIGKTFLNATADQDLLAKGVLASQGNSYKNLAQWAVGTSLLAYAADSLYRVGNGKNVKDPKDPLTYLDALTKSGAGGMYFDVFAGEWDKYSFAPTFLGPTLGNIDPLAKIAAAGTKAVAAKADGNNQLALEKGKLAAKEATKIVRGYIPFQQAVGVKAALDHAQWGVINEMLYPGSNARYEAKKARELVREQLGGE